MKTFLVTLSTLACLAVGCDKNESASTPAPQNTQQASTLSDDDVPVKADFTDEAEKSITESNYKTQLDELAKEIETPE